MLTIIAFVLTLLGSVNWLLIGLLQYDFIAGIFGFQASIFSRIIYIIIGAASVFLVIKLIKNKGSLPIWTFRNKKDLASKLEKMKFKHSKSEKIENVESADEFDFDDFEQDFPDRHQENQQHSLFDEHLDRKDQR